MMTLARWYRWVGAEDAWWDIIMLAEVWYCFQAWWSIRKKCAFAQFTMGRCPLMYQRWKCLNG